MYLRAISVGYAVPDGNFEAEVHSAFQSALNLRVNGKPYLLTLIASGEGDLPQGIRLDASKEISFDDFRGGDLVTCRDGLLRFENNSLVIQLDGARRWKCDLPALEFNPANRAVSAAWNFVWQALNERQRLAEAEIIAEELLEESGRDGVPHRASKAIRDVLAATRRYELSEPPVSALIGLGSGLTPGGDDLLVGYLTGLWCTIRDEEKRMQFISRLGERIIGLSAQTNDISRTYLYHAAQGQVASRLADLADAICHGANSGHLSKVAEAAFQVGHTSGMDATAGLLIGLATWTHLESLHE